MGIVFQTGALHEILANPNPGDSDFLQGEGLSVAVNNNTNLDLSVAADQAPAVGSKGTYTVRAGRTARLPIAPRQRLYYAFATVVSGPAPASPGVDIFIAPVPTDYSDVPIAGGPVAATVIRGQVNAAGAIVSGTGFSVTHPSVGHYTVTFTTPFGTVPAVVVTAAIGAPAGQNAAFYLDTNLPTVNSFSVIAEQFGSGGFADAAFCFIAQAT